MELWCCVVLACCATGLAVSGDKRDGPTVSTASGLEEAARSTSASLRSRIMSRMKERTLARRKTVCYDMVGCFGRPSLNKPLQKAPGSPTALNTKFLLYTRDGATGVEPAVLYYGDRMHSLKNSTFAPSRAVKVIIHGFKGSGRDVGAVAGATAFLEQADVNVIMVDWQTGAADRYPAAVANTELIGRQLGLLLLDLVKLQVAPRDIHLVGHSLGAHVAAVAGQVLKDRNLLVGRITGLDPASPLFKHQIVKDDARKLDPSDASLVDVIHTDGSPIWTNGFGLLRPLGHVDFFPNGGREQPGCSDGRGSVVVSLIEGTVNSSIACSHVRAWKLFRESISYTPEGCQLTSWPCPGGLPSFLQGHCFPMPGQCNASAAQCSNMGLQADQSTAGGAMYLVTRPTAPYCGTQLRVTVLVSEQTQRTRGLLHVRLRHGDSWTSFKINCEFLDVVQGGRLLWGLGAALWASISPLATPVVSATLSYQPLSYPATSEDQAPNSRVYFDKVIVADTLGNSWHFCGKNTLLDDGAETSFDRINITLTMNPCYVL